jgi:small multidrug resistance pump
MSWLYLILAIGFEVTATSLLKTLHDIVSLKTLAMLASYGISLLLLSLALKKIEIGVAYAVWSGLGIMSVELLGIIFFKESLSVQKIIFICLIMVGTIGLNFTKTA